MLWLLKTACSELTKSNKIWGGLRENVILLKLITPLETKHDLRKPNQSEHKRNASNNYYSKSIIYER